LTENEFMMLAVGAALGAQLALIAYLLDQYRADRRVTQAGAAALARAQKRHATEDWREALVRRPKLVELAQAEVRDFELGLLDSVDRVEDAAQREGLL
jgi:hypothetical protein